MNSPIPKPVSGRPNRCARQQGPAYALPREVSEFFGTCRVHFILVQHSPGELGSQLSGFRRYTAQLIKIHSLRGGAVSTNPFLRKRTWLPRQLAPNIPETQREGPAEAGPAMRNGMCCAASSCRTSPWSRPWTQGYPEPGSRRRKPRP